MNLTADQINKLLTGFIAILGIALPVLGAMVKHRIEEQKLRRAERAAEIKETEAAAATALYVTQKAQEADRRIQKNEVEIGLLKKELENARAAETVYIQTLAALRLDMATAQREIESLRDRIQSLSQPPPFSYSDLINDGPQVSPPTVSP